MPQETFNLVDMWMIYHLRQIEVAMQAVNTLLHTEIVKNHRVFAGVLIAQWVLALVIGFITDTLIMGALLGLLIIAVPIYLGMSQAKSTLSKHTVAIGAQLMAALHIQQTMGMTEMHFQVFVLLAFLTIFRDWRVIITGTVVVAVHHVIGFVSQSMDGSIIVFETGRVSFVILVIHAAFAVIECAVLAAMVKTSSKEHKVAQELTNSVKRIMNADGTVNLSDSNIPTDADLADLSNLLRAVKNLSEQSGRVSAHLTSVAGKVQQASIALDATVDDQNNQVTTISESMRNIVDSIHAVADLSKNAHGIADNAKNSTQETRDSINDSQTNIAQLKSTLQTTSEAISDLSFKCQNISEVMQSIKSVAEQTNLLALNAAIESARAGEHGRGFAVVADEVRNLAIKSKESAEEIEKITSLLTESANHSVTNMNNCVDVVELAVASSESATVNMGDVFSSIEQVNQNVTDVATSATEQAKASESISESTDHLNSLFVNERQQVVDLQNDVSELKELSDELEEQLRRFKM